MLESTTFPGTTREHLVPLLEESGLRAGEDFNLAFSPERVDPGRTDYTLRNTPKVVGGLTQACTDRAVELYGRVCDHVVPVSTPEVAELSKLLENIFRSVNIALVNEMAMLADRMGIDIWEVIDAAATKPFGFTRFDPGPGMGGHCLPGRPLLPDLEGARVRHVDRVHRARRQGQPGDAVLLPREDRAGAERRRQGGARARRCSSLGVAYKAGTSDMRESPALKIIELLRERGAEVSYHDPFVPELSDHGLRSVDLDKAVEGTDLAVIVTAHPGVDHGAIARRAPITVDFRGVTRAARGAAVHQL